MTSTVLLEAWAAGYAAVDHPDTFPLTTHGRLKALAAVQAAQAVDSADAVDLVLEAGTAQAARTANHRSRLQLYGHHRKLILAAAKPVLDKVDAKRLAETMILMITGVGGALDDPALATNPQARKARSDQAYSLLRSSVYGFTGNTDKWQQANQAALSAVAIRGQALAAASPGPGLPPDPKQVVAQAKAVVAANPVPAIIGGTAAADGIDKQLGALAWAISPMTVLNTDDPAAAVKSQIDSAKALGDSAEDWMHAWLGGAYKDWLINHNVDTMSWETEDDDRVCDACEGNEDASPWAVNDPDLPDMPAHGSCRCCWA